MTWDSNNGVTVVYDKEGKSWVINKTLQITDRDIRRGAYVAFSNDGGYGIHQLFPG